MKCKICGNLSNIVFKAKVLDQYEVSYYHCNSCDFIQTEDPYWLQEAYKDAVSVFDVWSVARPLLNSKIVAKLIDRCFPTTKSKFLDYGGGSGIFVRQMRDIGYDFIRSDAYSKNMFARCFDLEDMPDQKYFILTTSFEVFEHLANPLQDVINMFKMTDNIFFSTSIKPKKVESPADWDYIAPYHGQHISFYSIKALEKIAALTNSFLLSDGKTYHTLSKTKLKINNKEYKAIIKNNQLGILEKVLNKIGNKIQKYANRNTIANRISLTELDSQYVIEKLDKGKSH